MATKKITEKKTGEKYTSKAAMMKHEKGESKAEMKKEYGKVKSPLKMAGTVKAIATKSGRTFMEAKVNRSETARKSKCE